MAKKDTAAKKVVVAGSKATFNFTRADWPMGAKVQYTAERVTDHKGMTGVIVGYRPTNGLWVKFPNGKGSISVKTAKLVGAAPKASKTRSAKTAKGEPISVAISGGAGPVAETPAS